jgi:hypothetical protein
MTDAIKEREIAQNQQRVCINLMVLLDIGLFPGKHSLGIEECKGFVKALADDAASKLASPIAPAPVVPLAPAPVA